MDGVWVYYEVSSAPCWKAFSRLDQSRLEDARAEAACTTGDGAEDDGEEEEAENMLNKPSSSLPRVKSKTKIVREALDSQYHSNLISEF